MTLSDAASFYARRGWPVFPLSPDSKVPYKGSGGVHDATVDLDQVHRWWKQSPDANIALACGHQFDVLDVDAHHDGWRSLAKLVDEYGVLPIAPAVSTPNGGMHFYFQPTGISRNGFRRGLDWRGDGYYILAPPSVINDRAYEWQMSLKDSGGLWPVPTWLPSVVRPVTNPRPRTPVLVETGQRTPFLHSNYVKAAFDNEVNRVLSAVEGERNDALNRAAFTLARLLGSGDLDHGDVIDALRLAARQCGLSDGETEATLNSGIRAGISQAA